MHSHLVGYVRLFQMCIELVIKICFQRAQLQLSNNEPNTKTSYLFMHLPGGRLLQILSKDSKLFFLLKFQSNYKKEA